MTFSGINLRQGRRETTALAAFMLLQSVAAIFFVGDAFTDLVTDVSSPHSIFEFFVAFVLIVGIFLAELFFFGNM